MSLNNQEEANPQSSLAPPDVPVQVAAASQSNEVAGLQSQPGQLSFRMVTYQRIYFQQKLLQKWRNSNHPLPGEIVTTRNNKIILCYLEVVMDIFAIIFLVLRQSRVTVLFTIGNLIFLIIGIWATLRLHFWGLVAHATYSIGFIGGFVIFKIIDTVVYMNLDREASDQDDGQMSRASVRIISTLPQLTIIAIGIYSCILVYRLDNELEARRRIDRQNQGQRNQRSQNNRENQVSHDSGASQDVEAAVPGSSQPNQSTNIDQIQVEVLAYDESQLDKDVCIICLTKQKEIVFYPCGHQCLCMDCSQKFQQQATHLLCPICRFRIKDMIKVYK